MVFNSYIFILFFLPASIFIYFLLNKYFLTCAAKTLLLISSFFFYAFTNFYFLYFLLSSILVNYFFCLIIQSLSNFKVRSFLKYFVIIVNLIPLFIFKYFNFFVSNINSIFGTSIETLSLYVPLGISFITFQQISLILDLYDHHIDNFSFLDYAIIISFFPHISSGPIIDNSNFLLQINDYARKKIDWNNILKGSYIFSIGLAKKVVLANVFSNVANLGFSWPLILDSTNAIVTMFAFTFQIYFDFSGYSDMAYGCAKMFNFDISINFNSPYKAQSIDDFWKRWHISLTTFFTKYIYIPLGGNRKGVARTLLNIMIVFLVSGIWHGAGWTFLIWGFIHGFLMVCSKLFKFKTAPIPKMLKQAITFILVSLAWVFFKANTISDAFDLIINVFKFDFGNINPEFTAFFLPIEIKAILGNVISLESLQFLFFILFFVFSIFIVFFSKNSYEISNGKISITKTIFTAVILCYCIISLIDVNSFVYFNF